MAKTTSLNGFYGSKTIPAIPAIPPLPTTSKLNSVDDLIAYCSWINMLINHSKSTVSCRINGHRHRLLQVAKHSEEYVLLKYLGYDGAQYIECDIAEIEIIVQYKGGK